MDQEGIQDVISRALVCRLAMADREPYVVPLCFGYEDGALFFHSGGQGRKIDILRRNPRVCFEFDVDVALNLADTPCKCSVRRRSVIGFGTASFVEDREAKKLALNAIMRHYAGRESEFPNDAVDRTTVIRVDVESMTGRMRG